METKEIKFENIFDKEYNKMNYSEELCNDFWKNVIKPVNDIDDCWNYIGKKEKNGFIKYILYLRKSKYVHRFSFEYFNRKISNHIFVMHHCNNLICVNPNHLYLSKTNNVHKDIFNKDSLIINDNNLDDILDRGLENLTESEIVAMKEKDIKDFIDRFMESRRDLVEFNYGQSYNLPRRPQTTDIEKEEILKRYKSGENFLSIAKIFNRSRQAIRAICLK